jgi:hypothetical protein
MSSFLIAVWNVFKQRWYIAVTVMALPILVAFFIMFFFVQPSQSATMQVNFNIEIFDENGFFADTQAGTLASERVEIMTDISRFSSSDAMLQIVIDSVDFADEDMTPEIFRRYHLNRHIVGRELHWGLRNLSEDEILAAFAVFSEEVLDAIVYKRMALQPGFFEFSITYDILVFPASTHLSSVSYSDALMIGFVVGLLGALILLLYPVVGRLNSLAGAKMQYAGVIYGKLPAAKKGQAVEISEYIDTIAAKVKLSLDENIKSIAIASVGLGDGATSVTAGFSMSKATGDIEFKDVGMISQSAEALISCATADGVLIVISPQTKRIAFKEALTSLELAKANVIGLVFNKSI